MEEIGSAWAPASIDTDGDGIGTRYVVCRNLSDPQTVFLPQPEIELITRWSSEGGGLAVASGDLTLQIPVEQDCRWDCAPDLFVDNGDLVQVIIRVIAR